MVLKNDVKMINQVLPFFIYGPGYDNGRSNQNQANVTSAEFYMFRAFPENLKCLSSKLMIIWMLETTYVIRFGM